MLRIAQITDTFLPIVDGVGRVAYEYAVNLCQKGHQVTVVAPMYDTGYRGGYPFELVDFTGVKMPLAQQYQVGEAKNDKHYRKRIKAVPLDIIHSHSPFTAGAEAIRLAEKRNIPLVGTFHSKYYDDFLKVTHSESIARVGVKIVVDFYRHCDEVWAVGDSTAQVLRDYGYQGDIQIMPNGVSQREPDPEAMEEVRRKYGLEPGQDVFLFVGQMNWKKNIRCILQACKLLQDQGEDFRLILAGQGPDEREIRRLITELDLDHRVDCIGHIADTRMLDALYAVSTLFLFPSLYDNAPMVVREAAVMGTPSVLVAGSSAAEIILPGENGFLCRDSAEDLSRMILLACGDRDELEKISRCARETIPIPWSKVLDQAVERYEALIRSGYGHRKKRLPSSGV